MEVTRMLVEDVAAELGISEPSLVEKDYQVVQALSLLAGYCSPNFELVFAGGTCLSKTFDGLQRMSEDVDIKVLLTEPDRNISRNTLRRELRALKHELRELLNGGGFEISQETVRNENRFFAFDLAYAPIFDISEALRPGIKIEITFCDYKFDYEEKSIVSLIAQVMESSPEVERFPCINVLHTSAEKLVSLLRRTAASLRGIDEWADDTLIRHLYDLHIIHAEMPLGEKFVDLVHKTVMHDGEQFANRHKEFLDDPKGEIRSALGALSCGGEYTRQYERFLGPLVYSQSKPDYEACLATISDLAIRVWGKDVLTVDNR